LSEGDDGGSGNASDAGGALDGGVGAGAGGCALGGGAGSAGGAGTAGGSLGGGGAGSLGGVGGGGAAGGSGGAPSVCARATTGEAMTETETKHQARLGHFGILPKLTRTIARISLAWSADRSLHRGLPNRSSNRRSCRGGSRPPCMKEIFHGRQKCSSQAARIGDFGPPPASRVCGLPRAGYFRRRSGSRPEPFARWPPGPHEGR